MVRAALRAAKSSEFPRLRGCRHVRGTRGRGDQGATPTDEAALSARLKRLGERLEQASPSRSSNSPASRPATDHSGFARGFRLSSELVAGVLVGAALGWLIDKRLGTLPWGMFVFALLGFTAGVLNVMRQAGVASGGVPDSTDRTPQRL